MAIEDKNTLKTYFETGDKPTELQFASLIDSLQHVNSFDITINFVDLEILEFAQLVDYKITTVTQEAGITVTINLGGTSTAYTLGNTVSGGDKLDISVDIAGVINIKGERI